MGASQFFARANGKYEAGDYKGAIEDFNKAIQLNPTFASAFNNRGIAKDVLGDNKGAIDDFNKGIQLNPTNANAFSGRGNAKLNSGWFVWMFLFFEAFF